jgi:RNA polymerase sigma-70 factor (ECF subfamily)
MLGYREPAEDAVQETFLRAFRGLRGYDHRGRFRAWLFRILVNRCRTALDRERRRPQDPRPLEDLPPGAVPGVAPVDVLTRAALEAALRGLARELREAFLLRHVEQLSYEEMAAATGAGVSALKMRVARAKEGLRREFGHEHR